MKQSLEMQLAIAVILVAALALLALKDWPQLMDAAVLFVFGAK
jgi:hypothetical protein